MLLIVALVPITPILPFLVSVIANFAPGVIIPITGIENCAFKIFNATAEAVLHATIINLTFFII